MLEIYNEIVRAMLNGEMAVLATVISSRGSAPRKAGAKMLIKNSGTFLGTIGGGFVESQVIEKAKKVMKTGKSDIMHFDMTGTGKEAPMICGGQMEVFIEPIVPAETIYLCGAGHISQSVARIAKTLGFIVIVIDPRSELNNAVFFPTADFMIVDEYESAFSKLDINESSYLIICTQEHITDEQCLELAIGTQAKYIGMVGSKKKVREIKERLSQKNVHQYQLDRIFSPIGLPIGAETSAEIAISILAEIVKFRRNVPSSDSPLITTPQKREKYKRLIKT